jgi:ComF family protein
MSIVDLIFPKKCFGCNRNGKFICEVCIRKVKLAKQICIGCEKPAIDGMTHVRCKRPLRLDACTSIWNYDGVIRKALINLKYKFAFKIAEELADNIASFLLKKNFVLPKEAILIPIPLHRFRANWRGFNQVEEIGKLVCQKMGWEFQPDILVRKKVRRPQTELKGDKRQQNIRGVFSINSKYKNSNLLATNHNLLIFDDVLTTGATIKEAGKVLKRNGAKQVWGLTIAR